MAAAKGMLPLSNEELFEVLVALAADESEEVRLTAATTIDRLDPKSFVALAADTEASTDVLGFLCLWQNTPEEILETVIFNRSTPNAALARLAHQSQDPQVIEAISLKQQSLIQTPEIIDAILSNPKRTPEAERRATEVRQEFFEKRFGAQMIADAQRAKQAAEAAERTAQDQEKNRIAVDSLEDLVRLGLIDEIADSIDDALISEYEAEVGPLDTTRPAPEQQLDFQSIIGTILSEEEVVTGEELLPERKAVFQQIALMSIKERVMLAIKGSREARMILVRDPNRIVAGAVLRNPRITDSEIEYISSLKTAPEDVLRQIGQSRAWSRTYTVVHNLVRNPRTPIAISLGFLNRIQTRDLRNLGSNKNVPDVIRTTSNRLYLKRSLT
jgi:hypothetical protein